MITVEQVIDDLRAQGRRLPVALAGQLFCAAVRLVVKRPVSLRPHLLGLDEQEGLVLLPAPERDGPDRPGYVAPEVASGMARPDEPRALVYAAGALGYELLTGRTPPQPPRVAGAELTGPLAAMVRSALSVIRGDRPPGLAALRAALETEEAPPSAEQELAMFAALGARFNAAAISAPPAATSTPAPPARPAETAPSPPDAEVKIALFQKQVHAMREQLAHLQDAVLKQAEEQRRISDEQRQMAENLLAMRSEQERTVASLGKREEKLLGRLVSVEAAMRASQVEVLRRSPSWWPVAVSAGGSALLTLVLVLALDGRSPAPQPASHQEPAQPAPQAVEPAPQTPHSVPQAPQPVPQAQQPVPQASPPAHVSPPPVVPAPEARPPRAAAVEAGGGRAPARAPGLSGGLTAEQVRKKLEENRDALRGCVDEALRRDPNLRVRKILVATTIAPSGQVTAAMIDDRAVDQSPLGACLKRATRRIVFPPFAGEPFDVDIPIVINASDR